MSLISSIAFALQSYMPWKTMPRDDCLHAALTGKAVLHGQLFSSVEQITAEARSSALSLGEEAAWIERVVIKTEPVSNPAGALRADALGDLQRIIEQASADSQLV